MATVEIKVEVDSTGAVRSVQQIGGQTERLEQGFERAEGAGSRLGRTLEVAFGVAIQRLASQLIQRVRQMGSEFNELAQRIQDTNSEFEAVFRNNRDRADEFVEQFRRLSGFTTTETRKMVSEIGGIALSLGESDEKALQLAESSAMLALQWERIAGMDFARGQQMIALALTGNITQMQRAGIISRELTRTQFDQMTMQQRLAVVTEGLTARYGDLESATDGLTQNQRRMRGQWAELREQFVSRVIPAFDELMQTLADTSESSAELLETVESLAAAISTLTGFVNLMVDTFSGAEDEFSLIDAIFGEISKRIDQMNRLMGTAVIVGSKFFNMISNLHPALGSFLDMLGLGTERLQEWEEWGARVVAQASGFGDILRANRLLTQEATAENVRQIEKLIEEWEAIEDLDEARSKLLEKLREEIVVRRELVAQQNQTVQQSNRIVDAIDEITEAMVKFKDESDDPPDFQTIMDAALQARDVILRFGDDGRVSIEEMDEALKRLNEEIRITADPERRQQLIEYRNALQDVREEALGAGEQMADLTNFMQTTMANVLSNSIIQFTQVFEEIGRGSADMAQAALKALASIIRGIGQQLIAWGTSRLIMSAGTDPRGWAAVTYGTALAAGGGLISGMTQRGGGTGGATTSGIGIQAPLTGTVAATRLNQDTIVSELKNMQWEATATVDGEEFRVMMKNVDRRRKAQGFRD